MRIFEALQTANRRAVGFFAVGLIFVVSLGFLVKALIGGVPGDWPKAPRGLQSFEFSADRAVAPETPFEDENGLELTMSTFQGKVVLVNLWATWCAPCLKEMPTLDRLRGDMMSESFDVVAISVDKEGPDVAMSYLEDLEVSNLDFYIDENMKLNFDWEAYGLPTTILLDEEGREIGRLTGTAEWDAPQIERFLGSFASRDKD